MRARDLEGFGPVGTNGPKLTHAELVERAARWLRTKGCKIVLTEFVALCPEIPDAIGWKESGSYLIECKTSRSDFLADKKKSHRQLEALGGEAALGQFRYFLCPPGLIAADELPPKWGLLYAHKSAVTLEAGHDPRKWSADGFHRFDSNLRRERTLLLSALNRLRLHHGDAEFRERVHATFASKQATA